MDLAVAKSGLIILSISSSLEINPRCFIYSGSLTLAMAYFAPSFLEIVQSITFASSFVVVAST